MRQVTKEDEMRRGFTAIELMIVMVIIAVIAAIAIPNLAESTKRENRIKNTPITYTLKNSVAYIVRAACSNCQKYHKIESTAGIEVKTDHACPWCGVKASFTLLADE